MTYHVQWSCAALDDIKNQIAYIAKRNPSAARRTATQIYRAVAGLGVMATGRPGRVAGTYEKSITGLPYIIAYSITAKAGRKNISILRVVHTARDWRAEKWPK